MFCILAAFALVFMTIGCEKSFTTANVKNAIITDTIDSEGKPGAAITSFASNAEVIYASAELHNAPDNTTVRIVWIYDPTSEVIYEAALDSGDLSDRYIYASISPTQPLPEGEYRVDFYVEDRSEPDATAHFRVEGTAAGGEAGTVMYAPPTGGAYLEDVHLTSGFNEAGEPLDKITRVGATGTWVVSAVLRNTQPNTMIHISWFTPEQEALDFASVDPQGMSDVYISGSLEPYEPMPEGTYYVVFFDDGGVDPDDPIAILEFTVSNNP